MPKTGELLKKELGLENIRFAKILRIAISSYKILLVAYNSYRPTMPITSYRLLRWPFVGMLYHGTALFHSEDKIPPTTPPMDIEEYNGSLRGALVMAVDLAGYRFVDEDVFTKVFESKEESREESPKTRSLFYGTLKEALTIADLADPEAMSGLTRKFRKERTSIMKGENVTAKLADVFVEEGKGTVVFAFLTEATEKYAPEHEYQEVDPNNLSLRRNTSKVYEVTIEVEDFFEWLGTYPDKDSITREDIKEILDVSNVRVFSTSPSLHFQGMNFNLSQMDASRYPTNISPDEWGPRHGGTGNYFVDKHMYGIIRQIVNRGFFLQQMASSLTSKLKQRGLI